MPLLKNFEPFVLPKCFFLLFFSKPGGPIRCGWNGVCWWITTELHHKAHRTSMYLYFFLHHSAEYAGINKYSYKCVNLFVPFCRSSTVLMDVSGT